MQTLKRCISVMLWYMCTIFRENRMPVLKPFANDKMLFARFFSLKNLANNLY